MAWWQQIVDWWRNIVVLLESMASWQQGLLIILAIVSIGISIFLPIVNLFTRPPKRLPPPKRGWDDWRKVSPKPASKENDPLEELMRKHQMLRASVKFESTEQAHSAPVESARNHPAVTPVEKQIILATPNIFEEIRYNLAIAVKPWNGSILAFQTDVWYSNRDKVSALPGNLQNELAEAYVDMGLANDIVWLSKELGRRNPELDEAYLKLRNQVALRLRRIVPAGEPVNLVKR